MGFSLKINHDDYQRHGLQLVKVQCQHCLYSAYLSQLDDTASKDTSCFSTWTYLFVICNNSRCNKFFCKGAFEKTKIRNKGPMTEISLALCTAQTLCSKHQPQQRLIISTFFTVLTALLSTDMSWHFPIWLISDINNIHTFRKIICTIILSRTPKVLWNHSYHSQNM